MIWESLIFGAKKSLDGSHRNSDGCLEKSRWKLCRLSTHLTQSRQHCEVGIIELDRIGPLRKPHIIAYWWAIWKKMEKMHKTLLVSSCNMKISYDQWSSPKAAACDEKPPSGQWVSGDSFQGTISLSKNQATNTKILSKSTSSTHWWPTLSDEQISARPHGHNHPTSFSPLFWLRPRRSPHFPADFTSNAWWMHMWEDDWRSIHSLKLT